jgi:multiple antibiotic resistance protein
MYNSQIIPSSIYIASNLQNKRIHMLKTILSFIVMMNPFALFLYLSPVMKDLKQKEFLLVLIKATFISYAIILFFILSGDFIFAYLFQIEFNSFRIFGGIVIFSFAYFYIVKGKKALIQLRGSLDDLAAEIAMPFMVGAGTISLAILAAEEHNMLTNMVILPLILIINFSIIVGLKFIRDHLMQKRLRIAFNKSMGILLRITGFFVGAIGIDMILIGIQRLYLP